MVGFNLLAWLSVFESAFCLLVDVAGLTVGSRVGVIVALTAGDAEGLADGDTEGLAVGNPKGLALGFPVGAAVFVCSHELPFSEMCTRAKFASMPSTLTVSVLPSTGTLHDPRHSTWPTIPMMRS